MAFTKVAPLVKLQKESETSVANDDFDSLKRQTQMTQLKCLLIALLC